MAQCRWAIAFLSYGSVNNVVYETGGRIGKAAVKYGFLAVFFELFIDLIKTL